MDVASALRNARASIEPTILILEDTVAELDRHHGSPIQMRNFICRSLLRAGQLLDSCSIMAEKHRYQDVWILGRTLSELSINTCYLQIAPEIELTRWTNYDVWTDERLITNLALEIPNIENLLNPRDLLEQRQQKRSLDIKNLYQFARKGTWSEKSLEDRARIADKSFSLTPNVLALMYRLAVKVGDGFVHTSPRGLGEQKLSVRSESLPSTAAVHATAQALSMAATSALAATTFIRSRFEFTTHPLADRLAVLLHAAYQDSAPQ